MIGESDYLTSGRRRRCVVLYPNSVCGQGDFRKKREKQKSTLFNAFALPRDCGRDCIGRQKKWEQEVEENSKYISNLQNCDSFEILKNQNGGRSFAPRCHHQSNLRHRSIIIANTHFWADNTTQHHRGLLLLLVRNAASLKRKREKKKAETQPTATDKRPPFHLLEHKSSLHGRIQAKE